MSAIVVLCTIDDANLAQDLALKLVQEKLAACVSVGQNITSFYEWKEKIESLTEVMLLIKTEAVLFDELKTFIEKNHPYDVPEIIAIPIVKGNNSYLRWIKEQTKG